MYNTKHTHLTCVDKHNDPKHERHTKKKTEKTTDDDHFACVYDPTMHLEPVHMQWWALAYDSSQPSLVYPHVDGSLHPEVQHTWP